jgi:hypothetical protein
MLEIQKDIELFCSHSEAISWKVPAMFCNDWAALRVAQICAHITDEVVFDRVYGAPRCVWSGGRPSAVNLELGEDALRRCFEAYRQVGTTCTLTLSRTEVANSMFADPYCNMLLSLMDEYNGEVIVFNDELSKYIRKSHPNIKQTASIHKPMCDYKEGFAGHKNEDAYYHDYLELYDEVVIRCEFASDDELLSNITDIADRCEIIVNQFCAPNCTQAFRHIKAIEDWNHRVKGAQPQACFHINSFSDMKHRFCQNLFMSQTRIDYLVSQGFTNFKLAGRNSPLPKFLEMTSQYVFEPTGAFQFIKSEVMNEYQALSDQIGQRLNQTSLPDEVSIRAALKLSF